MVTALVTALGPTPLGLRCQRTADRRLDTEANAPGTAHARKSAPTPTPEVTTARAPHSRVARLVLQRASPRSEYQL